MLRASPSSFSLCRGHHLATGAVQQRAAELLFEAPHLLADGGLGEVYPFTGAGKTAAVDDGDKAAQQRDPAWRLHLQNHWMSFYHLISP